MAMRFGPILSKRIILPTLIAAVICACSPGFWGINIMLTRSWRENSLPGGEHAERFLPYWDDYIYIQSLSGRFYVLALNPELDDGWREVDPIYVGELGGQGQSSCAEIDQPWRPMIPSDSPIRQGLECGYWNTEGEFIKYSFAILENGEIWRWFYK